MTRIEVLRNTKQNIFTSNDLVSIWRLENRNRVNESVKDYIRRKRIFSLRRGIYSLNKEYNKLELAQKLISPSYISYYTALAIHGIIFQQYSDIHCFASYSKNIFVDNQIYQYHQIKENVLLNTTGLNKIDNYTIASPERAICDSLYITPKLAFDNLKSVSIETLKRIVTIYENTRLEKSVMQLISNTI